MRWAAGIFVILSLGCTRNDKVPSDLIQRPKMEKILWEMVEADRFATSFIHTRKDTLGRNTKETVDLYDKVFNYNGTTRQEFLKSYQFYLGRPDMLKVMFDSVSARAERKRSEIYNHPKPNFNKPKSDSLKIKTEPGKAHNNSITHKIDSTTRKLLP